METAKDYYVRRMRREDVGQVVDIDREAFPSIWPVPNYRRELENRLAHYIVVCDRGRRVPENDGRPVGGFKRFNSMVWRLLGGDRWHRGDTAIPGQELILGFAGIWVLVDEAHLTNIAVRELERERGVGELLLISIIEMSQKLKAIFVTLEVRASNTTAQNLYTKYGFKQVGVRRHYYTDNREDALLMTTDGLSSTAYQERIQDLKQRYIQKWGRPQFQQYR